MTRKEKQRQRLIELLKQLFQLDQPDLDFGFYQIMHAQAETVTRFLEQDLLTIIKDSFGELDIELINRAQQKYQQTLEQARLFNLPDPEANSLVREARAHYEALLDKESNESEIYEHLYRFFERYYDDGDFMSRRYHVRESGSRAAPYAVPYDGQEVYLHWANRDQYYIKTTEHLPNFSFDLANAPELKRGVIKQESLKLHCRIVAATEGEHNNNKTTDKSERFFIAHAAAPIVLEQDELVLQFEYRPDSEKSGTSNKWQERRLDEAEATILRALTETCGDNSPYCVLRSEIGADNNQRTLLRKYLNQYTKRNTTDYFIHKDLDSFLRRELDFYIKNEIMRLDDIENADAPRVENYLARIRVLRKIAGHLISFLAQLENFQKKLWLKKKFVTDTQYCLTLDRIPEALYSEIAANAAQREEWLKLFAINELDGYSEPLSLDFLRANPFLVLDTAFFSSEFKDRLTASIADLDESLDGLLIHSENFQALGLMQEKYRESIPITYIDPPYNTVHSEIVYKNQYKHSTWLSLIANTIPLASNLWPKEFSFGVAIDDYEHNILSTMLKQTLPNLDKNTIVINHHPQGSGGKLSRTHEYLILLSNKSSKQYLGFPKDGNEEERNFMRSGTADNNYRIGRNDSSKGRWKSFYALLVDPYTNEVVDAEPPVPIGADYPTGKTSYGLIRKYPINSRGEERVWRSSFTTGKQRALDGELFISNKGAVYQRIENDSKRETLFSNWTDSQFNAGTNGSALLSDMGIGNEFDYPKAVGTLEKSLWAQSFGRMKTVVLDYFSGSATTAHAAININRKYKEAAVYFILVEMGNYFDKATLPRVKKATYSHDWKDGKPISRAGISHAFKYIRLESYEDTLNNLSFKVDEQAKERQRVLDGTSKQNFKRSYMLKYWLDFETQESQSLLNIGQFEDPTAYKLKIKQPDSEQYQNKTIDLVESFNWLIGLHVDHIGHWRSYSASFKREPDPELPNKHDTRLVLAGDLQELASGQWQLRRIEGRIARTPGDMRNTDQVLVIWRRLSGNLEEDNAILDAWFEHYRASTDISKLDIVYVNGSNNLQRLSRKGERWQVHLIESAFHQQMWAIVN